MNNEAPIFLDTNTLIRANIQTAPRHAEAIRVLRTLRKLKVQLWISRQVLREYLAVVTCTQTFMQPMDSGKAASRIVYFQTHFHIAEDNASVMSELVALLKTIPLGGKQVHDANIVATMRAYRIQQLLTLNPTDFARFSAFITILSFEDVWREPGSSA
jgi:predicted nucleic acid-binding protein